MDSKHDINCNRFCAGFSRFLPLLQVYGSIGNVCHFDAVSTCHCSSVHQSEGGNAVCCTCERNCTKMEGQRQQLGTAWAASQCTEADIALHHGSCCPPTRHSRYRTDSELRDSHETLMHSCPRCLDMCVCFSAAYVSTALSYSSTNAGDPEHGCQNSSVDSASSSRIVLYRVHPVCHLDIG